MYAYVCPSHCVCFIRVHAYPPVCTFLPVLTPFQTVCASELIVSACRSMTGCSTTKSVYGTSVRLFTPNKTTRLVFVTFNKRFWFSEMISCLKSWNIYTPAVPCGQKHFIGLTFFTFSSLFVCFSSNPSRHCGGERRLWPGNLQTLYRQIARGKSSSPRSSSLFFISYYSLLHHPSTCSCLYLTYWPVSKDHLVPVTSSDLNTCENL